MRLDFSLRYPADIRFGVGVSHDIVDILRERGVRRPLICHSRAVPQQIYGSELFEKLSAFDCVFLTDLPAEAPLDAVAAWIDTARRENVDAVVAVGGGSVMDAAKAVASIAPYDLELAEVFHGRAKIPAKGHFFAALPTTAGTGSEMTPNAVLYDPVTGKKQSIRGPGMLPDCALIDPALTLGASREITINSGLDALVQAIESYLSRKASPATMPPAAEAVKLLLHALRETVTALDDVSRRIDPALGSMLAGLAFANSGLGAVHGLAHPLGARFAIPHGRICAILLLPVLKYNFPVCEKRLNDLAEYCGISGGAMAFLAEIEDLMTIFEIPKILPEISDADLAFVIANSRSNSMSCNPRELPDDDIAQLLRSLSIS